MISTFNVELLRRLKLIRDKCSCNRRIKEYSIGGLLMSLIEIANSDDFVVDYDPDRGMYRVSIFKDRHFWDEFWFDAYEGEFKDNKFDIKGYGMSKEHNPKSKEIYDFISKLDFENGDYFCFKSGGDGDNGEFLMDLLDCYFLSKQ